MFTLFTALLAFGGSLTVTSQAFQAGDSIPQKFTCEGENINPPLHIAGLPAGAKSIVVLMDDPDAPSGTFDHWVVWNIKPSADIAEHASIGTEGKNGAGKNGYIGPCPPSGSHRYYFKVYALDGMLDLRAGSGKEAVLKAIEGHVLSSGELMGLYRKVKGN